MKVLIATDGSEYSQSAVEEYCRMFAEMGNSEVKIISVYENVFPIAGEPFAMSGEYYQEIEDSAKAQAEAFAAKAAEEISRNFPNVDSTIEVKKGSPEREILETAQEWNADLIVVGSHGRGFWGRILVGSTSNAILHHAPCSVLVIRRKGESS